MRHGNLFVFEDHVGFLDGFLITAALMKGQVSATKGLAHNGLAPRGGWGRVSGLSGAALHGLCAFSVFAEFDLRIDGFQKEKSRKNILD
jgi:hypothetical protein